MLYAQDINYGGNAADLQSMPSWYSPLAGCLFPSNAGVPLSSGNRVTVNYISSDPGSTNPGIVLGGLSQTEDATNNSVELIDGHVTYNLTGGESFNGGASGNTVTISGGRVNNYVRAGESYGDAKNNTLVISGGSIGSNVISGVSTQGNAEGNIIIISGGSIDAAVEGGWASASAAKNTVLVSGGIILGNVRGGFSNNLGDATDNEVTISGTALLPNVYGGWGGNGNVSGNSVAISGGYVVYNAAGGFTFYGLVTGNSITITDGRVGGNVYGGQSNSNANAIGNKVAISGGRVDKNVYGGYSNSGDFAINNTVTISGVPDLTSSDIYGGYVLTGLGNAFSGNTLNFKSSNLAVKGIYNFENYNFYLPDGTADGDIMLRSASAVDVGNTNVAIFLQGDVALQTGDRVALINSAAGVGGLPLNNGSQATALLGSFLTYDFSLYTDSNNLWAKLISAAAAASPVTKAITNSRLAPLAFVNQGADLAAAIDDYAISRDKTDSRYTAFAAAGGGSSTYDTGSDIDVDGVSLIAGVIWDAMASENKLLLSAFVEAGWGDYDTNNSFGGTPVRGSGDMNYYGGGIGARYQLTQNTKGSLYADASLRVGKIDTDFSSKDALNSAGTKAGYDSDSTYYGAHLGLGYVWRLNDKTNIDISSKYLWTRLDGDEFISTAGDRIKFDDADSRRWRTGFRVNHARSGRVTLYFGMAYEYEFDGDATGQLFGTYAMDKSSLSGGTGIGELGIRFKPSADNDRLTLQLGLQGYVGTREGVSGGLKLLYEF